MPREIDLSTMVQGSYLALDKFTQHSMIDVRHHQFAWATGWNDVLQIGLYQKGPDVSEVGSTWLENLNDMRAVRPFSPSEMNSLGGENAFINSNSSNGNSPAVDSLAGQSRVVGPRAPTSVPWMLDTRLINYRRDLLDRAHISPEHAFESPEALLDTLMRLQAAGIDYPLALATNGLTLHNMASFVWGRGGDFRSPDCRKIALVEPEARRGLLDFFSLHRFIHPEARQFDYAGTDDHYYAGRAAVLVSGQWVMKYLKDRTVTAVPTVFENTAYASLPGIPYLGGTNLVIWRHTLHEQSAISLLAYLTDPDVLRNIFNANGGFPARTAAFNAPPFSTDRDYQLVADCLRRGRAFQSAHLWAGVEMRLSTLCDQLWADVFANPELDLEKEIEQRVSTLASRLEKTILASW